MTRRAAFRHPRYEILATLASGGMGTVSRARDLLEGGREVALKVYPRAFDHTRLEGEFLALRALHHPGVARALHFGRTADDTPFFTLELIPGDPLDRFLAALSAGDRPGAAAELLLRSARTVSYLHRRQVLHLDIKPDNILVVGSAAGSPRPILLDFGLARERGAPPSALSHASLPYAPPEVFTGAHPTAATDVYSLAATFYRVFSGRSAVAGKNLRAVATAHERGGADPLPEVPPALERVLLRALARDPRRRHRDAVELSSALDALAPGEFFGVDPTTVAPVFHEPDFVGRKSELERLLSWIADAPRERPLFEISGPAGVGKTRFLERAVTLLESRGHTVLELSGAAPPGGTLGTSLLDGLRILAGESRKPSHRQGEASTARLLERLVPRLAAGLHLAIDDLERATPLEVSLIEQAARALCLERRASGGILVARGGDEEPRAGGGAYLTGVTLRPFHVEEALAVELEGTLAGVSAERAAQLKRRLHAETAGHPLFFVRGLLDLSGGGLEAARLAPAERVAQQVAQLPREDRPVLVAALALGRAATLEELAVGAACSPEDARGAATRLRSRGLLASQAALLRLPHTIVEEAVRRSLPASDLAAAHRRVGQALAAGGTPSGLAEAAWHLLQGGESAAGVQAARSALGATSGSHGEWTPRGAAGFELAAGAAERLEDRLAFLEAAADALEEQGRFSACVSLRKSLDGSLEIGPGKAPTPESVRRRRKLGASLHRLGSLDEAVRCLSWCLEPGPAGAAPHEALVARSDLALLHHFRGESDRALELARGGIDLWERGPPSLRTRTGASAVHFHSVVGQVLLRRLELAEAREALEAGLKIGSSEEGDNRGRKALLLNNLGLALHLSGKLDAALSTFARAESAARSAFDAAALASVRSNQVQILARKGRFREARALLDEIEESPAATESRRLRLNGLYTRCLYLLLLGTGTGEDWARVEILAREAQDDFLATLARLYGAEASIPRGAWSSARRQLAELAGASARIPFLEAARLARLSLVEALLGRRRESRDTRRRLDAEPVPPALVASWNHLHAASAALETADFEEARHRLESAQRGFRETGLLVGEIEGRLLAADIALREAARQRCAPRLLDEAATQIAAALALPCDAAPETAPRLRELRATVLEARESVLRTLSELEAAIAPVARQRKPPARQPGRQGAADLLARALGDPLLPELPCARLELEILRGAAAQLTGQGAPARQARAQAHELLGLQLGRLAPEDRASCAEIAPWDRLGLGGLGLERESAALGEDLADALEGLLGPARDRAAQLERIGKALGLERLVLVHGSRPVGTWTSAGPPAEGPDRRFPIWAAGPGSAAGWSGLVGVPAPSSPLPPGGLRFLEIAALVLAREGEATRSQGAAKSPGEATTPIGPGAPKGRDGDTLPIHRTKRLSRAALRSSGVEAVLEEEGFVAVARETLRVVSAAAALARTEMPILITGDSGTGKSLLARVIHRLSARQDRPFLAQSASAIPPELFEADLFGYESGAFTGAERSRTGFLFQATGGTFHLEEVGDLTPELQTRFLRVVEEGAVRPLGATNVRALDVRFIASSQRDLEAMARRGEFRRDLFYRLGGAHLHLPRLCERKEDLAPLVERYWRELTGARSRFPAPALEVLRKHDWPGNVRELTGSLRRLALQAGASPTAADVRAAVQSRSLRSPIPPELFANHSRTEVERMLEEAHLQHLWEKHSGSLDAMAEELQTSTRSIYRRFERLGLKPGDLGSEKRRGQTR